MTTLDRYIIKQFVVNFVILAVVLMGLYILIDLIVDLDEFLEAARKQADNRGGFLPALLWVMMDYYVPAMMLVYTAMSGLIVVAAMGFTITQLQRNRELTAIMAGGVSLYRVAAPILIAGFVLNLLVLPVQELMIPPLAEKIVRPKPQLGEPTIREKPVHYARDGEGALLSAASFRAEDRTLTQMRVIERDTEGRQTRMIRADKARWDPTADAWRLSADARVYAPAGTDVAPDALTGQPIRVYPSELSPEVLIVRQESLYLRLQSVQKLESMRGNMALDVSRRAQVTQLVWSRFSTLVLGVLILLMAMPFFLTRVPGSLLAGSSRAAAMTVGAWAGGLVLLQVGGLNPITAAWLPVVIYLPVAFYQATSIKT
ncbi:MAG: LptF/LptG family permease [Planctomycetota bacterium]